MRYIIVSALCLLLSAGATAAEKLPAGTKATDTNLVGHVLDAATGEHIAQAVILIKGTSIGATTDETGHCLLANLADTTFTLVVSHLGYRTLATTVSIKPGATNELNFSLEAASIEMDQIVVSSSRREESRSSAPVIVNILQGKTFAATCAATPAEGLNYQSGLRMEYTCHDCGVPQLRINGLGGQYSQILLDSRPIFSSLASVYGLEQIPAEMIDRVEVVRGGASALYGASAIGGVVNIITKEPTRNLFTAGNTTGIMGNSGATDINTSFNGMLVSNDSRAGAYIYGVVRDRGAYDRDGDGYTEVPKLKGEAIGMRGYYKTGSYSRLSLEYHHLHEFRRGGDKLGLPPFESDIAEQLEHYIDGGGVTFDISSPDHRHNLKLYTALQSVKRDSYFGGDGNTNAYGKTSDLTLSAGAQYSLEMRRLLFAPAELTAGIEESFDHLEDAMPAYGRLTDQKANTLGVILQNEWKSEKFNLVVGARAEHNNMLDRAVVLCPRVNMRYSPSEHFILRAGYSSGYRAPQVYDEDLHIAQAGGDAVVTVSAPGLKPEYSHSFTASGNFYTLIGKLHTDILAEGFYTHLTDMFVLGEDGQDALGNDVMLRTNAPGATVAGVNLEARLSTGDNFSLQLGYTYQRSRYDQPFAWSDDPSVAPVRSMLRSPDSYGYFVLNTIPTKQFGVSLFGNVTGSMPVQHMAGYIAQDRLETTRAFFDGGFRLSYDIHIASSTLQLSAGIKNVFNSYQSDLDKGASRDTAYIYGPALPRTFVFGVKFSL